MGRNGSYVATSEKRKTGLREKSDRGEAGSSSRANLLALGAKLASLRRLWEHSTPSVRIPKLHENAVRSIYGQPQIRETLFLYPRRQARRTDRSPTPRPIEPELFDRERASDGGDLCSGCSGCMLLELASCTEKVT